MAGRIFVNSSSGPDGDGALEDLRRCFAGHIVEACPPTELADRVREARSEEVEFIGVAGGDGSIRCAAQELQGTEIPLLVIPAGTRNHFANDLGIPDLEAAQAAARTKATQMIDVGRVNDYYFVNNSSIGTYPEMVRRREMHERRMSKRVANLIAAYQQLRRGRRLRIEIDGDAYAVWMVFVGNGSYGDTVFNILHRDALDDNTLDVRIVHANRRFARLRLVFDTLVGRLGASALVEQRATTALRVSAGRSVDVTLDGEVEQMPSSLEYQSVAHALAVLVPGDDAAVS